MKKVPFFIAWMMFVPLVVMAGESITYPHGLKLGGAAAHLGAVNHQTSPYFKHLNFYNSRSTKSLIILPRFNTYQQTTEYTCGPAALVMAAYYRGVSLNELEVAKLSGSTKKFGTSTRQMVNYLKSNGWNVRSSLTEPRIGSLNFLRNQIKKGNPIMVEWIDWAGHWQVVIGYDDMGTTSNQSDDVIIMADPYDTSDHLQDGYYIVPADRFQYMWFDHNLLPKGQRNRQWIIFNR
ncbi:conserved hypothetical protein [Gammaproteobacteria bacterium]